jgi:hypothetical protein
MIFMDALSMKFRNVKLRERNLKCVVCGPDCPVESKVTDVSNFDYEDFCQTKCSQYDLINIPADNSITVQ